MAGCGQGLGEKVGDVDGARDEDDAELVLFDTIT
jgi:hypothetical protein